METHYYEVDLHWQNTRKGTLSSQVLNDEITVVTPPEFKGGIQGEWSPEHLFTAAASSCLMTTFLAIAENSKLDFISFDANALATLEMVDGVYMISKIVIKTTVSIRQEEDKAKAIRVIEKAEKACLISNSMKSQVIVVPNIIVA